MSSRTRSRRPASIGSNQSSRRWTAVPASDCRARDFVLLLLMAWSPPARKRRHRLGFNHPETTPPAIPTTPRTAPRRGSPDDNRTQPLAGPPPHPGEVPRDELEARGISAHALAIALRLPASRISQIVRCQRGITPETALRLARYFGGSAAIWFARSGSLRPRARRSRTRREDRRLSVRILIV